MKRAPLSLYLVCVSLLGALTACGGDTVAIHGGKGEVVHLELAPAGAVPPDSATTYRQLEPRDEIWRFEGEGLKVKFPPAGVPVEPRRPGESNEARKYEPAIVLDGEVGELRRAIADGPFPAGSFNRAVVKILHYSQRPEPTRLVMSSGGEEIFKTRWISVPAKGPPPEYVVFDMPQLSALDVAIDEVALETKGDVKTSALFHVDLLKAPEHSFLPAHDSPTMFCQGVDGRMAVGLFGSLALECEAIVPDQGEFHFSYTLERRLVRPGQAVTITTRVTPEEGEPLVVEVPVRPRRAKHWVAQQIDVSSLSGQRVSIRFELGTDDGEEAFCLIGEPRLIKRGREAPTVLLVTSDTHRADHLSRASDLVKTPVLDALAEGGIYFSNAYASTNVTNPSHASLMTGLNPRDTRILNNATPLAGAADTVAEGFREGGYRTFAAVSAFHLMDAESGLGQGFDRMNGPTGGERSGEETVEIMRAWLEQDAGVPAFVWLHLFDAHAPYAPPRPYSGRYWDDGNAYDPERPLDLPPLKEDGKSPTGVEIPPFLAGLRDKDFPYEQYRAEVDYVDFIMGEALSIPRIREGIVAFTSDHGESFGEHGVWWDHAELYPETVAVPMILSWPGGPEGLSVDEPVRQIDVARTLLDISGLYSTEFPGRNLSWSFDSEEGAQARRLISAHGNVASIQDGSWMLILHLRTHHEWALERKRMKHEVELYDLEADPSCLEDLARVPAHKETARGLRRRLIDWLEEAPAEGLGTSKLLSEASRESLAELGYADVTSSGPSGGSLYEEDAADEWCRYFAE